MKKLMISLLWLACAATTLSAQAVYDITGFGAVADGKTVNTKAIQKAINKCSKDGGGRVLIPNGTFVCGSIWLKDNVELYLEPSAVLLGSNNFDDYEWVPYSKGENEQRRSLIFADGAENIAVTGRGTVCGNGTDKTFQGGTAYNGLKTVRPYTFFIDNCKRVKLSDFTMYHGAYWNIKLELCDDVTIDGITVNSRVVANNDGIDLVDCSNLRVVNCNINAGDDGLCLKSHRPHTTVHNVTISNCTITSESNAIKFGVASEGGFENIAVTNCALYDTRLAGIALEIVEGGSMDRIVINNITMNRVNGALFMKVARKKGFKAGSMSNIIISNIVADEIGHWKADRSAKYHKVEHDPRIGVTITGQEECRLKNVTLSNLHLTFAGGGTAEDATRPFKDSKAHGYPEYNNFGITPAYGINCAWADGIRMNNIVLDYIADDVRPAMYLQNVENVTLNGVYAEVSDAAKAYMRLVEPKNVFIINSRPVSGNVPFCSFEGSAYGVSLMNNDLSGIDGNIYVKDDSVDKRQIRTLNNIVK